jgi:biopolymer transport protein ExbD
VATIQLGGRGARKSLDAQVLLVPFIDLLLCCVMFLLVTAVWNDLATIQVRQFTPGGSIDEPEPLSLRLVLSVRADGYELSSAAGEHQRMGGDLSELRSALQSWRKLNATAELTVSAEDGVHYASLIEAVDLARASGFDQLTIGNER